MQQRVTWWDRVIHGAQHKVFRLVSFIFSGVSAWAIYWFFSALGDEGVQHFVTVGTSLGFVALGYFVTRGLAFRLLTRRRVRSYVLIAVLYILVEVSCNFGHAVAKYPDVLWIQRLTGWQFTVFSFLLPVVLSIIPLFNIALAVIDVDLMHEKGVLPAQPVSVQPKAPVMAAPVSVPGLGPQAVYPAMPVPGSPNGQQGAPNALKAWWDRRKAGAQQAASNGAGIP